MTEVLVVGEALVDIVIPIDGDPVELVGGSPANVAIGIARLGQPTRLATYIGVDERGKRIAETMTAEGVGLTPGSDTAAHTPTATARLGASGQATYAFDITWAPPTHLPLRDAGHVHTGSVAATLEPGGTRVLRLVERARLQATVSYDPNIRPSLMHSPATVRDRVTSLLALSDVVKASDEDVAWLYGAGNDPAGILQQWRAAGPALAVLTLGSAGALAAIGSQVYEVPPLRVRVTDTVGAGDSFMSGLICGLLERGFLGGLDARARLQAASWAELRPALEMAVACSAVTVTRAGSDPPRRGELAKP